MNHTRMPPPAEYKAARLFNLTAAGLVFCLMLGFAAWVIVGAVTGEPTDMLRLLSGAVVGLAATLLLVSLRAGWRSGQPFQHTRMFSIGMALFGIGVVILLRG